MRIYADTSFLIKILSPEPGSDNAKAEFQRLSRPQLPFLAVHRLEASTAFRQRAFQARRSGPPAERTNAQRIRDAALARIVVWTKRGWLVEKTLDWELAYDVGCDLSERHANQVSARSLDLLHVAFALQLDAEVFLSTDHAQAHIARAEGLTVPELET